MVGTALAALLQGVGYDVRLIEDHPASKPEELLEGAKLLLVAPALEPNGESSESALAKIKGKLNRTAVPVLTLSTTVRGALVDQPGFILWPCRLEDLTAKIVVLLSPASAIEEAS